MHSGTSLTYGEDAPGRVVAIWGSVIDVWFPGRLPLINTLLFCGERSDIVIEVQFHLDERHVRGIALTPAQGLARGVKAADAGRTLEAPVGDQTLSRMYNSDAGLF